MCCSLVGLHSPQHVSRILFCRCAVPTDPRCAHEVYSRVQQENWSKVSTACSAVPETVSNAVLYWLWLYGPLLQT